MKLMVKIAFVTGIVALACGSAAMAAKPADVPKGNGNGPAYTPAEPPSPPDHANAYGVRCKGESKEHVKGEKGTAFSRCVHKVNTQRKEERKKEKEAASA